MEYPLRTLAMVAQVHAGMWRRNGYAIMNQVWKGSETLQLQMPSGLCCLENNGLMHPMTDILHPCGRNAIGE